MHKQYFPGSSVLRWAAYDEDAQELFTALRTGRTYVYREVQASTFDRLLTADSAGKFYNLHIKDRHDYSEVAGGGEPR